MTGTQPVTIGVANANFVTGFLTGVARVLEGGRGPCVRRVESRESRQ